MSTYLDELARELYGADHGQDVWDEKVGDFHADAEILRDAADLIDDLRRALKAHPGIYQCPECGGKMTITFALPSSPS